MKFLTTATLFGLALLGTSCGDSTSTTDSNDEGPPPGVQPQLTKWETVVDKLAFPTSGDSAIKRLTIGRKEYNANFANRGDVEVLFDQDTDVITIEMRKYDFSDAITAKGDEAMEIEGTFERMELWAYNAGGSTPAKPTAADRMDPTKNCALGTWKDGCSVFVYYDGQSQPVRSGADFKVHLPKAWRGELNIQTEDNENEATYPRRGNVTVSGTGDAGWCSSGTVKMSAGVGKIRLCRNLLAAPTCTKEANEKCNTFEKDDKPAGWDMSCGCTAMQFGQLRIESLKPWSSDITVDMPDTTWVSATIANMGDRPNECSPVIENCSGSKCNLKEDGQYSKNAEFNYPGNGSPAGAGFNLTVQSAGCANVDYFADPDDWAPDATAKLEERGHIKLCTGCLN